MHGGILGKPCFTPPNLETQIVVEPFYILDKFMANGLHERVDAECWPYQPGRVVRVSPWMEAMHVGNISFAEGIIRVGVQMPHDTVEVHSPLPPYSCHINYKPT